MYIITYRYFLLTYLFPSLLTYYLNYTRQTYTNTLGNVGIISNDTHTTHTHHVEVNHRDKVLHTEILQCSFHFE